MLRGLVRTSVGFRKNFRQFSTSPKQFFIYKTVENVRADGNVKVPPARTYESRRYILRKHGMGFSFHELVVYKGKSQFFNYANHLQAVMVTQGTGYVEIVESKDDLGQGKRFQLKPGCLFALDNHEKHWLTCDPQEDLHLVAVYTPPIQGQEQLNDEGVYPYIHDNGVMDYDYWARREARGERMVIELKPKSYRDSHYYDLVKEAIHSS